MNLVNKQKTELDLAVSESINKVEKLGYTVLYAANYGSHNYNLDINNDEYQSDIDTKVIILPTLEELVYNTKPISTTIEISTGQCDIKDIRAFIPTLLKANIQFLEILTAQSSWINPVYAEDFQWFIDNLTGLIAESKNELLKSIKGMCCEKQKALCHPYPTIKWKIDKWGYDGKQLHHIMRLKDFIDNYFYEDRAFHYAIWYEDEDPRKQLMMQAKLNKLPLKQALDWADIYCSLVVKEINRLVDSTSSAGEYRTLYKRKTDEIIIKNIKKKILEDEE